MDNILDNLLTRGVEEIIVKKSLEKKLTSGQKLRVKFGIDPTGKKIHLGRASVLRKLKAFQELGHTIVLIIGDFTALIGDPSDKLEKRPMLTKENIEENLKDYKKILGKILDLENNVEFHYNSKWLSELKFDEICKLAESFSVQQMLSRRNFKERFDDHNEISLREFMYPLMQGYDSIQTKSDLEIGGFDQLFNLKAGRIIQKHYGQTEQDILTCEMLEGTDGRKMSTSWENVINTDDEPSDMFGKVMSLKDELIIKYFTLVTDLPMDTIEKYKKQLLDGENPKNIKIILAENIVSLYHSTQLAEVAKNDFIGTFEKGGLPADIRVVSCSKSDLLVDILVKEGVVSSKSEFRRLVSENAVKELETTENNTTIYKIGKRRFIKIIRTED